MKINKMRKTLLNLIAFASFSLVVVSCATTYKGGYSATPNVTIDYNIKSEIIIDTTKVLQGSSETKVILGIFSSGDKNFSDAFGSGVGQREKMAATYKALDGTKYDILVNPKYVVKVKRSPFVKSTSAVVSGYGAKIKLK
jgi:protein involved in ribonucleotide reduction